MINPPTWPLLPAIHDRRLAAINFSLERAQNARECAARCESLAPLFPSDGWPERAASWRRSEAFWSLDVANLLRR